MYIDTTGLVELAALGVYIYCLVRWLVKDQNKTIANQRRTIELLLKELYHPDIEEFTGQLPIDDWESKREEYRRTYTKWYSE
jgi:hypothetical protein